MCKRQDCFSRKYQSVLFFNITMYFIQKFVKCVVYRNNIAYYLLVIVFIIIVGADSEVAQFVRVLVVGDHTDPITKTVLFQVLFRKVLQIGFRKMNIGVDEDLHLLAFKCDIISKVVNFAVNLQMLLKIFFLKNRIVGFF